MNPCHPKLWFGNYWLSDSYWGSAQMLTSGMHIEDFLLCPVVASFVVSLGSWELGLGVFAVSLLSNPVTLFNGLSAMLVYEGKQQSLLRASLDPGCPSLIPSCANLLLPQGSPTNLRVEWRNSSDLSSSFFKILVGVWKKVCLWFCSLLKFDILLLKVLLSVSDFWNSLEELKCLASHNT